MRLEENVAAKLLVLSHETPLEAAISDHNMLINNGILFFNMMMQCRWNAEKKRYNNGFGIVENDRDYQKRIAVTVKCLAEVAALNPQIYAIGLVEAPITEADITLFISECNRYPSLSRFKQTILKAAFTDMGVATFIDADRFNVTQIPENADNHPALHHRVQEYLLQSKESLQQLRLLNLHLPYDFAKSGKNSLLIGYIKQFFQNDHNLPVTVIGDFNLHPTLITKTLQEVSTYVQDKNNLLLKTDVNGNITGFMLDTVDGILQSNSLLTEQPHRTADASLLPWNGVNLRTEYQLLKSLLQSNMGFFTGVSQQRVNNLTSTNHHHLKRAI